MNGSGSPLAALQWWHEIGNTSIEELAVSGELVRWGLKIGTALLMRAKDHPRQSLFLRQLTADSANHIHRGRQSMKLIMHGLREGGF